MDEFEVLTQVFQLFKHQKLFSGRPGLFVNVISEFYNRIRTKIKNLHFRAWPQQAETRSGVKDFNHSVEYELKVPIRLR